MVAALKGQGSMTPQYPCPFRAAILLARGPNPGLKPWADKPSPFRAKTTTAGFLVADFGAGIDATRESVQAAGAIVVDYGVGIVATRESVQAAGAIVVDFGAGIDATRDTREKLQDVCCKSVQSERAYGDWKRRKCTERQFEAEPTSHQAKNSLHYLI